MPQNRQQTMKRVDDFRLKFGKQEFVPIMTGGMGVDISTAELALVAARLGGIGHISDAMVPTVSDRRFKTGFVKEKQKKYKYNVASRDKSPVKFDLERIADRAEVDVATDEAGVDAFVVRRGVADHLGEDRFLLRVADRATTRGDEDVLQFVRVADLFTSTRSSL